MHIAAHLCTSRHGVCTSVGPGHSAGYANDMAISFGTREGTIAASLL